MNFAHRTALARRTARSVAVVGAIATIASTLAVSAVAAPAAAPAGGGYVPVAPTRLLDTRHVTGAAAPVGHGTVALQVAGVGPVPVTGASAVVLNVTVTAPVAAGFVTVYADGSPRPIASNLNYLRGQTVPNLVVAPIGADGKVDLYNGSAGATQLVADVEGYYVAGAATAPGAFTSTAPTRLLDTRLGTGGHAPAARGTVALTVDGVGPVPRTGVAAVVLNVTVTAPVSSGFVTVFADGSPRPTASNLNYTKGQTVPNLVIAPVGANGEVDLYNDSAGATQLVADVEGYYLAGTPTVDGTYASTSPTRLLDTRLGTGGQAPGPRDTVTLQVAGVGPVPKTGVAAVAVNVTVTHPVSAGYVTVFADGTPKPVASNLNYVRGQTVPNLVIAPVGADGRISLRNDSAAGTQLVADVAGYYLGSPAAETVPPDPITGLVAVPAETSVALSWTNPGGDYTGVTIRRASGTVPPASPTDGMAVADLGAPARTYVDSGLTLDQTYSYALFAHGGFGDFAMASARTVKLVSQSIAGTVSALATGRPISGMAVTATRITDGATIVRTTTAENGTYLLSHVQADTDYRVCVDPTDLSPAAQPAGGYEPTCAAGASPGSADGPTAVFVPAGQVRAGVDIGVLVGGAVTGSVTDSAGLPIAGVGVQLGAGGAVLAHTAADGTYQLRGVTPGRARVCFTDPTLAAGAPVGFASQCFSNATYSYQQAATVPVSIGQTTTGVDAVLKLPVTLRGRVIGPDSAPIAGVTVADDTSDVPSITDADGSYVIVLKGPGWPSRACATPLEPVPHGTRCAPTDPSAQAPDGSMTNVDIRFGEPFVSSTVTGTVLDLSGRPLKGVLVSIDNSASQLTGVPTDRTAADGTYTLRNAPRVKGGVSVCFTPSSSVTPPAPAGYLHGCVQADVSTPSTADVDMVLKAAGGISGTVLDTAGFPLPGLTVDVGYASAKTDAGGHYLLTGLLPRTDYTADFVVNGGRMNPPIPPYTGTSANGYLDQCFRGVVGVDPCTPIAVVGGAVTVGIDATIQSGGAVSGRVTDESGRPLRHLDVTVSRAGWSVTSETDGAGDWSAGSLAPGAYAVCFAGGPPTALAPRGYERRCYQNIDPDRGRYAIAVASGLTITGINSVLTAFPVGAISGRVTDVAGHAVGGVAVGDLGADTVLTKADGTYVVTNLPVGSSVICVGPVRTAGLSGTGYQRQCYGEPAGGTSPRAVPVVAGRTTTGINVQLPAGGAVAGVVTSSDGAPVRDVDIKVSASNGDIVADTYTDAGGRFFIGGLRAAGYQLTYLPGPLSNAAGGFGVGRGQSGGGDELHPPAEVPVRVGQISIASPQLPLLGSIVGTVHDDRGEAVSDAYVDISDSAGHTEQVYTDSHGAYLIDDLAVGNYRVCFLMPGTPRGRYGTTGECYQETVDSPNLPVVVAAGERTSGIDGTVSRLGGATVLVTDRNGEPLENVAVQLLDAGGSPAGSAGITDVFGSWNATGIEPGTYTIRISGGSGFGGTSTTGYGNLTVSSRTVARGAQTDFGTVALAPL